MSRTVKCDLCGMRRRVGGSEIVDRAAANLRPAVAGWVTRVCRTCMVKYRAGT